MLEVFVAISAAEGKRGSRSANRARFASAFSTIASTTRSAEPTSAAARSTRKRRVAASTSPGARKCRLDVLLRAVLYRHVEALQRAPRGDVDAHRSRADDVNAAD